jgi:hypothetical protein
VRRKHGNDPVVGEAVFRLQRSGCHRYKQPINSNKLMHMENDGLCILSTANSFMKWLKLQVAASVE